MEETGTVERNPLDILSRLRGNIEAFEQYLAGKIDIDEYTTDLGKKTTNPKKKSLSKFERGNRLKDNFSRFANLENEALPNKDIAQRVVNPSEFADFIVSEESLSRNILEQFDARLLQLERFRLWRPSRGLFTGADAALNFHNALTIAMRRYQQQQEQLLASSSVSPAQNNIIPAHEKLFLMMGYSTSGPTRTLAFEIQSLKKAPEFMYEGQDVPFILVRYAVKSGWELPFVPPELQLQELPPDQQHAAQHDIDYGISTSTSITTSTSSNNRGNIVYCTDEEIEYGLQLLAKNNKLLQPAYVKPWIKRSPLNKSFFKPSFLRPTLKPSFPSEATKEAHKDEKNVRRDARDARRVEIIEAIRSVERKRAERRAERERRKQERLDRIKDMEESKNYFRVKHEEERRYEVKEKVPDMLELAKNSKAVLFGYKCAYPGCDCTWCEERCSRCRDAYYCSERHQKDHWKETHRIVCKEKPAPTNKKGSLYSGSGSELWDELFRSIPRPTKVSAGVTAPAAKPSTAAAQPVPPAKAATKPAAAPAPASTVKSTAPTPTPAPAPAPAPAPLPSPPTATTAAVPPKPPVATPAATPATATATAVPAPAKPAAAASTAPATPTAAAKPVTVIATGTSPAAAPAASKAVPASAAASGEPVDRWTPGKAAVVIFLKPFEGESDTMMGQDIPDESLFPVRVQLPLIGKGRMLIYDEKRKLRFNIASNVQAYETLKVIIAKSGAEKKKPYFTARRQGYYLRIYTDDVMTNFSF